MKNKYILPHLMLLLIFVIISCEKEEDEGCKKVNNFSISGSYSESRIRSFLPIEVRSNTEHYQGTVGTLNHFIKDAYYMKYNFTTSIYNEDCKVSSSSLGDTSIYQKSYTTSGTYPFYIDETTYVTIKLWEDHENRYWSYESNNVDTPSKSNYLTSRESKIAFEGEIKTSGQLSGSKYLSWEINADNVLRVEYSTKKRSNFLTAYEDERGSLLSFDKIFSNGQIIEQNKSLLEWSDNVRLHL